MGENLQLAVATNLIYSKQSVDGTETYTTEEIRNLADDNFDLTLYDLIADEQNMVQFAVKDEVFQDYIASFVQEQFVFLGCLRDKNSQDLLDALETMTVDDIYDHAEAKNLYGTHMTVCDAQYGVGKYLMRGDIYPKFQAHGYCFYSEGKVASQSAEGFLNYMRNLVDKVSKNPLAGTFFVNVG